jgi:hypothetical protein
VKMVDWRDVPAASSSKSKVKRLCEVIVKEVIKSKS